MESYQNGYQGFSGWVSYRLLKAWRKAMKIIGLFFLLEKRFPSHTSQMSLLSFLELACIAPGWTSPFGCCLLVQIAQEFGEQGTAERHRARPAVPSVLWSAGGTGQGLSSSAAAVREWNSWLFRRSSCVVTAREVLGGCCAQELDGVGFAGCSAPRWHEDWGQPLICISGHSRYLLMCSSLKQPHLWDGGGHIMLWTSRNVSQIWHLPGRKFYLTCTSVHNV